MSNFSNYLLKEEIQKVLIELGYETPTPIQDLAIPKAMEGLDLIASAQTGTGKTAAFMLPILHLIATQSTKNNGGPSALILVPTRELAMQVSAEIVKFSKYLPYIKTVCVYGGVPYPIQRRSLNSRYDILVATPGRLIDHMERGRINLSKVKFMVLDEADRMLDMGFIDAVEQIAAAAAPQTRQTLLFSATIDNKIKPISKKLQKNALEIRIEPQKAKELNIEQRLYYVDNIGHKNRILDHILENTEMKQTIIFTATKQQADELSNQLFEKGYSTRSLHGDMTQRQRTQTINRMRKGEIVHLVATDVAARGIDISTISHVINFDLPRNPEDFIHRIGRTGRAGASGVAITFAAGREERWIAKINQLMGKPLTTHTINGLEPQMRRAKPQSQNRGRPFDRNKSRWAGNRSAAGRY